MSQISSIPLGTGTGAAIEYIAGNSGGNVGPTGANVINLVGSGDVVVTGVPGTSTLTISLGGAQGFEWSAISANQAAVTNNGYICNKASTLTLSLPAASSVGDLLEAVNNNTATGVQLTQAAGQQVFFGSVSTTLGATGTLTSSVLGDSVRLVCTVANTTWRVISSIGNWTFV